MVSQIAERYGQALFDLALEMDSLELWQTQTKELLEVFSNSAELDRFFNAVKISTEEKRNLIRTVFEGKIEKMLLNFLALLIDKKRIGNVKEILQHFILLANEERGIENGVVVSSRKLSKDEISQIEEAMSLKRKQKVELVNKVDRKLISGVKVIIKNEVIDGSMKSKIETLKNELLKESR